jgi:hypothetical protein
MVREPGYGYELVDIEAGSSYKSAVNVLPFHETRNVARLHGATIKNSGALRCLVAVK